MNSSDDVDYDWSLVDQLSTEKQFIQAQSELLRILPGLIGSNDICKGYYKLAMSYFNQKKYSDAIEPLLKANKYKTSIQDKNLSYEISLHLGIVFVKEQTAIKALPFLEQLINDFDHIQFSSSLIEAKKERKIKNQAFYWMGRSYWLGGDISKALHYFQRNLALSKVIGEPEAIIHALHSLGEIYRIQGNLSKALQFFQSSQKYFVQFKNKVLISDTEKFIAHIYREKGKINQAYDKYFLSFSNLKDVSMDYPEKIAEIIFNIMRLNKFVSKIKISDSELLTNYPDSKLYNPNIKKYKLLIDYITAFNDRNWSKAEGIIDSIQNLSNIDFNYQILCYESLVEISLNKWLENKSNLSLLTNLYSKLDAIKIISLKNNLVSSLSKANFIHAKLSSALKNYSEAEEFFKESLSIANRYDLEILKKRAHLELQKIKMKSDIVSENNEIDDSEIKDIQNLIQLFSAD